MMRLALGLMLREGVDDDGKKVPSVRIAVGYNKSVTLTLEDKRDLQTHPNTLHWTSMLARYTAVPSCRL